MFTINRRYYDLHIWAILILSSCSPAGQHREVHCARTALIRVAAACHPERFRGGGWLWAMHPTNWRWGYAAALERPVYVLLVPTSNVLGRTNPRHHASAQCRPTGPPPRRYRSTSRLSAREPVPVEPGLLLRVHGGPRKQARAAPACSRAHAPAPSGGKAGGGCIAGRLLLLSTT